MTNDTHKATNSGDEWLGPDPSQSDEEPTEFNSAGAQLYTAALQEVVTCK
jgi:hypothetical protein